MITKNQILLMVEAVTVVAVELTVSPDIEYTLSYIGARIILACISAYRKGLNDEK